MAFDGASRGHLILKSHKPLPRFACAIPVPHPDTSINQLRSTIVAILTGQISAKSASNVDGIASGSSGNRIDGSALSYSEHLKQVTIHEWRMKSLILELRQNALIAPETRNAVNQGQEGEESMSGFELQDDHECALLEHGDEVNLWLKPGQEFESLRLPKLPSRHLYGLPNQPTLDRSGTLLGNPPPAYTQVATDFTFTPTSPTVREPAEPSSHSSSVSAHPDVQFETSMRHWAPPNQHRVVVVGNNGNYINNEMGISSSNTNNHSNGVNKPPKKEKPKRLNSAGYFSPQLIDQKQREREREKPNHQRTNSGPAKVISPVLITPALDQSSAAPNASTAPLLSPQSPQSASPPYSPPLTSPPPDSVAAQLRARQASLSKAEKQEKEKIRRSGMKKMPSEALIVGPGVQGKFGRMASYDNRGAERSSSGGTGKEEEGGGGGADSHGNFDAFVSFTAASSDVHQQARPQGSRVRRPSSRSLTSDKLVNDARRPSESRRPSSSKLDKKPVVATLTKTENSSTPTTRATPDLLPHMPMPKPIDLESPSHHILTDSPTNTHSPALHTPSSPIISTPIGAVQEEEDAAVLTPSEGGPTSDVAPSSSTKGLTKAERRYLEVKKALEAEKERQSQEEKQRKEAVIKREADKLKSIAKFEEEQRKKKEAMKWELWEDVRNRQAKEKGTK